jgi:CobQ/CobB/MinD/ParA nucleotide binding domain
MASPPKRIILILGGKGGTGKTLFCRLVYYALIKAGVNCLAFDADTENPEFAEYHERTEHPVRMLDFLEVAEAKTLFTELDRSRPEVALLDMPGASGKQTREQMERFGLFNIAHQLGYRVTIATVLNTAYNTINSLDTMVQFCADRADYLIVKSQLWNQGSLSFERWDKSATQQACAALRGIEINLPVLEASAFDALHEQSVSFFQRDVLGFGDQILVDSFLDLSQPQIEQAAPYLGYPQKSTSKKKPAEATA